MLKQSFLLPTSTEQDPPFTATGDLTWIWGPRSNCPFQQAYFTVDYSVAVPDIPF